MGRCYVLSEDLVERDDLDGGEWKFCEGRPQGHKLLLPAGSGSKFHPDKQLHPVRPLLANYWYSMSYLYYSAVGFMATITGGLLITWLTDSKVSVSSLSKASNERLFSLPVTMDALLLDLILVTVENRRSSL
ncbi:hypothetical protein SKAU_G00412710 [Synaphobranchus kaupii]|uniref:Uncharacterized protein n=1 Tax=Synaphobranchus kaupii TaxID=118154 RepID=A0A9Q1E859_SYNKA|nr:hypothetical protein SKAU_G00412710 [Synaphobranchus kaupii]